MADKMLDADLERAWRRFCRRWEPAYGAGHAWFARHAVFPVVVTPDLLYQMWFNFRLYEDPPGEWKEIHRMAVSDLLLSGLLRATGHDTYEAPAALRVGLLNELKADPRFGPTRLATLAAFLDAYCHVRITPEQDGNLREIWQWTAASVLNPGQAARDMARQFGDAVQAKGRGRQMQVSLMLDQLGGADPALRDLGLLAEGMLSPDAQIALPAFRLSEVASANDILRIPMPPELSKRVSRAGTPLNQLQDLKWKLAEAKLSPILDLSSLDLEELPEELAELTHLEELDLKNNRLTRLPAWFSRFTQLKRLRLSRNQLEDFLPDDNGLPALQELTLNNNRIAVWPASLFACPKVRKVLMSHNWLDELPSEIFRMARLAHLDLGYNRLERLPESLVETPDLRLLYVHHNQLTRLPHALGRMKGLEILQAHHNQLTHLPASLTQIAPQLAANDHENVWRRGLRLEGNAFAGEWTEETWRLPPAELVAALPAFSEEDPSSGLALWWAGGITPPSVESELHHGLIAHEMNLLEDLASYLDPFSWNILIRSNADWPTVEKDFKQARKDGQWIRIFHYASFAGGLSGLYETGYHQKLELPSWFALQEGLELVFLNTSYTFSDAQALQRAGIPAVIGIEGKLSDEAAIEFAREFYQRLLRGTPLGEAFALAESYMLAWGDGQGEARSSAETSSIGWNYRHHLLAAEDMLAWKMTAREEGAILRPPMKLFWEEDDSTGTKVITQFENTYSQQSMGLNKEHFIEALSAYPDRLARAGSVDEADGLMKNSPSGRELVWAALSLPPTIPPQGAEAQTGTWLAWISRFFTLLTLENPYTAIYSEDFELRVKWRGGGVITLHTGINFLPTGAALASLSMQKREGKDRFWCAAWAEQSGRIRALHTDPVPFLENQDLTLRTPVFPEEGPGVLIVLISDLPLSPLEVLAQDPLNGNLAAKTSSLDQPEIPTRPDWQLFRWPINAAASAGAAPEMA